MFSDIFFFTYIFAGFIGLLAILLTTLLSKYWASANKRLLAAVRNFMICTAALDALVHYKISSRMSQALQATFGHFVVKRPSPLIFANSSSFVKS